MRCRKTSEPASTRDGFNVCRWLVGPFIAFIAFGCGVGHALEPFESIDRIQRTTWEAKDGAPGDVWAIAQTRDGWLWFGGPTGLYRFDGIRFTKMALEDEDSTQSQAVSALFATDSGALFIGRYNGGISVFEGGRFTHYFDEAVASASVLSFAQDAEGVTWAATRRGMVRFNGQHWEIAANDWSLPVGRFESMFLDRQGTFWAATPTQLFSLARRAHQFIPSQLSVTSFGELIQSPDGRGWLVDVAGVHELPGQVPDDRRLPTINSRSSNSSQFSRDGKLWTTIDARADNPLGEKLFPEGAKTVLEDAQGNIWVATAGQIIHRLRRKIFEEIAPGSLVKDAGFAVDDEGMVWIASWANGSPRDGLYRFDGRALAHVSNMPIVHSIRRSADGAIWIASEKGLSRREGAQFRLITELPPLPDPLKVRAFAVAPGGTLWVSLFGHGLFAHIDGHWERNRSIASLPDTEPNVLEYDSAGRLWIGYRDGGVMVVDGDRASVVGTARQTLLGAVTAMSLGRHTLVGGDRGLSVLREGQFVPLAPSGGIKFEVVTGIVQTGNGDVWVNCIKGAVRISLGALDGPVVDGRIPVSTQLFDTADGYPGLGTSTSAPLPSMYLAPDGKVWLSAYGGIASVDPASIDQTVNRPKAVVVSLTERGRVTDASNAVKLDKGTRDLALEYTALDTSHPDRLQFRYRLVGYETDWVEAGSRRQVFYTNLAPATYRFEVEASNESGLWSESPTTLEIEIPPTFRQSRSFLVLCGLAFALVLVLLYRMRVRQLTARERARLRERASERERIARELHDTLLQSTQALILRFQALTQKLDASNAAKLELEQTVRQANDALSEARDRVQDLRAELEPSLELSEALAVVGSQLAAEQSVSFSAFVEGRTRQLRSVARQETYRIGREALLNAFRHSKAGSIEVLVAYEKGLLRMRVRDDGRGIASEILAAGGVAGHWGLKGMDERARELGGTLGIRSEPGGGTEIELTIPARLAYRETRIRFDWLRRGGRS